jgi:hypothetical protein
MARNTGRNNSRDDQPDDWEIDDNLDDVQTRGDAEEGRFLCVIEVHEKKESRDGTKEFFNIAFRLKDAEDEKVKSAVGALVYDIFNTNKDALWKIKGLIKACGKDASGSRIPNLKGHEVVLDVFEDDYDGKKNWRTRRYKNPAEYGWTGLAESRTSADDAKDAKDAGKKTAKADDAKEKKQLPPGSSSGGAKGGGEVEI